MTFSYALQTTLKKALKAFETEGGLLFVNPLPSRSVKSHCCTEICALDTRSCADAVQPQFFGGTICEP